MIVAEKRGEYDFGRAKDSMTAENERGERIAVFLENAKADKVCIAVDLPDSRGTRSYAVDFDWLLEHLRNLEPNNQVERQRYVVRSDAVLCGTPTRRHFVKIEGTLVELGDLDGNRSLPGMRIECGDAIIEVSGLTRNQIMELPNMMFQRVVITIEAAA